MPSGILSIDEEVDLAVIATPASTVHPSLISAVRRALPYHHNIRRVQGDRRAGKELENEIVTVRKKYGMRNIGPNCIGIVRPMSISMSLSSR
jgi:acetyltransferase